jgi:hypothetical protein
MNLLTEEIEYKTEEEFKILTSAIQEQIDSGNLKKYIDRTWGRERRNGWNGEYISIPERKMYKFIGSYYYSTSNEARFEGKWKIFRDEKLIQNRKVLQSQYQIRYQKHEVYSSLKFEVEFTEGEKMEIEFEWTDEQSIGNEHSRMIKSSVEYGIISAFEDINPKVGKYIVKLLSVRYHPIGSSFSLLNYTANRNLKRALFIEHEDENPRIENGKYIRTFRPNSTVLKLNS